MRFYINTVTHEVHKSSCDRRPTVNESYLGIFNFPSQAVAHAKSCGYVNADGCAYCCPGSHTK